MLDAPKPAFAPVDKKDHPLFQTTQQMIRLGRAVLKRHQAAERELENLKLPPRRETWKGDEQQMRQLLLYGRRYGERLALSLLTPAEGATTVISGLSGGELGEAEGMAADLFEKGRKAAEEETWGRLAYKQVRALTGAVRTLPPRGGN